jgi:hypothetical protein
MSTLPSGDSAGFLVFEAGNSQPTPLPMRSACVLVQTSAPRRPVAWFVPDHDEARSRRRAVDPGLEHARAGRNVP